MRRLRSGLVVLAAAVTVLGAAPVPASIAAGECDGGCVTLRTVGSGSGLPASRSLSIETIESAADLGFLDYGDGYTTPAAGTTSVHAVLVDLLEISPEQVTGVDLVDPGTGQTVTLSGEDLAPPAGASGPPVFYQAGRNGREGQVTFIRRDPDTGERQRFEARELTGTVRTTGDVLAVRVDGPRASQPRATETYTVNREDGTPIDDGQVTWDFGDGTTLTAGASVTHQWADDGRYAVHADVQVPGGGGVGGTTVLVGDPPEDQGPPGGGGATEEGPTTGGPGQGGQAGGTRGRGGSGSGGPGARGNATDGTAQGRTPGSDGASTASPNSTAQAAARQRGKQQRPTATGGEQVQGVLLDAAAAKVVPAPSVSSPTVASATTRAATDLPTDWRWLLAGVPLVLLLAGGATRTRWLTRRLPEPPWRSL